MDASTPTVGRIVHFVVIGVGDDDRGGQKIRPAIVTAENGDFPSLAVFHEHALEFLQVVPADDEWEPGTWHWPPRQ